jgi:hypothetical protein
MSAQVRSSSSSHGPASFPASFIVAVFEFRSVVILNITWLSQFEGRLEAFQPPPIALIN